MDFLFHYATFAAAIILFLASIVVLIVLRRRLPTWAKTILIVVTVLCGLYLAFILAVVIAFGQGHRAAPPLHLN